MKKLLAILLALALMFSFAACGKDKDDKKDDDKKTTNNEEPVLGQNQVEVEIPNSNTEDILGGNSTTSSGWKADMRRYEQIIDEMMEAALDGEEDLSDFEEEMEEIDERMEDVLDTLSESEQEEFQEEAMEMLERLTDKYGDLLEDLL